MTSSSAAPSTPNEGDDPKSEWTTTSIRSNVPLWVPISAFIGTSLMLSIPMFMVRRNRKPVSRMSLGHTTAKVPPPPRRSQNFNTSTESTTARLKSLGTTPTNAPAVEFKFGSLTSESESPTLTSAMSQLNRQNGLLAGKAFAIATAIVTVGGLTAAWGVKSALGVRDAREFGIRVRSMLWASWPGLTSSIHRVPPAEGGQYSIIPDPYEPWTWDDAEKRMQKAYDEGGYTAWAQAAFREVETEARVERAQREREIKASSFDQVKP